MFDAVVPKTAHITDTERYVAKWSYLPNWDQIGIGKKGMFLPNLFIQKVNEVMRRVKYDREDKEVGLLTATM